MPIQTPKLLQRNQPGVAIGKTNIDAARQFGTRGELARRTGGPDAAMARNREPADVVGLSGQRASGVEVVVWRFVFQRGTVHPILIRKNRRGRGLLNIG